LIVLGREFDRITGSWADLLQGHGDTDTEIRKINQLLELLGPIETAIVATPARTIEGLCIKARAANWSREGKIDPLNELCTDERMAWSIVRDLMQLLCV
jgi:hypothetical protein